MWPFTRRKQALQASGDTRSETKRLADEALARSARRKAANRRVIDNLRAAQAAKQQTMIAEADHVRLSRECQRNAETTIRKVQEKATEVSGIIKPPPGKTMEEAAAEAEAQTRG